MYKDVERPINPKIKTIARAAMLVSVSINYYGLSARMLLLVIQLSVCLAQWNVVELAPGLTWYFLCELHFVVTYLREIIITL